MQSSAFVIAIFEFVLLIFSISVHECAHAWMASRLGDQTARMQGRVTLNPMYHIDPVGTLLIPALVIFGPLLGGGAWSRYLIGWGKPTPVITRNLRNLRRDDTLITLAGPVSNLLIAFAGFLGMAVLIMTHRHILQTESMATNVEALWTLCEIAVSLNLSLFFFNLLPIPPLDGSHVARNILPYNWLRVYDGINIYISYFLMLFVGRYVVSFFMAFAWRLVEFSLSLVPGS